MSELNDDPELAPLKEASNVLLPVRLARLKTLSTVNLVVALLCLVYIAINLICLIINAQNFCYREGNRWTFHYIEFGSTFGFAILEVIALLYSPKSLGSIYSSPNVLKVILFLNVVASFFSFAAVMFDLDKFEVPSHEIEYLNELTMTFVDGILLWSLVRSNAANNYQSQIKVNVALFGVASVIAITQIGVYNGLSEYSPAPDETTCGWYNASYDPNALAENPYDPKAYTGILGPFEASESGEGWEPSDAGEQIAHFFEFAFEMISAFITFWFCMDNKIEVDTKIEALMLE